MKKPKIMIRKATMKDLPELVEMWKCFINYHKKLPAKINFYKNMKTNAAEIWRKYAQKCIRSRNASLNVAEVDNKLVGYSLLTIKKDPPVYKTKETGYFVDIFVKNEYRGLSISSMLQKEGIKWFKSKGLEYASLMVNPKNKHAHSVYLGWGFFDFHVEMRKKI